MPFYLDGQELTVRCDCCRADFGVGASWLSPEAWYEFECRRDHGWLLDLDAVPQVVRCPRHARKPPAASLSSPAASYRAHRGARAERWSRAIAAVEQLCFPWRRR
jgi:hypothetical protein